MSTYYDIKTGKWFDTLADLKAFQRGEDTASPRSVSKGKVEPPSEEEPVEEQETPDEVDQANEEEPVMEVKESGEISIRLSKDEMEAALREAGVDGRSLRYKDETALAHMYANMFGH